MIYYHILNSVLSRFVSVPSVRPTFMSEEAERISRAKHGRILLWRPVKVVGGFDWFYLHIKNGSILFGRSKKMMTAWSEICWPWISPLSIFSIFSSLWDTVNKYVCLSDWTLSSQNWCMRIRYWYLLILIASECCQNVINLFRQQGNLCPPLMNWLSSP